MADAPRGRGGFGTRGDRGPRRGRRGRRGPKEEKEWMPVTKLGRLVKAGKITSIEQIYLHSLPIKEYQIVDFFLPKLKDEVMKVHTRSFLYNFALLCGYGRCRSGFGNIGLFCARRLDAVSRSLLCRS